MDFVNLSSITTYDTALIKRRTDNEDSRTKNTNSLTDEELLERYEKYVDNGGSGDRGGGGGSRNKGISCSRKEKRKRVNVEIVIDISSLDII